MNRTLKDFCKHGHILSADTVYVIPKSNERRCKECNKWRSRKHYIKHNKKPKRTHCKRGHDLSLFGRNAKHGRQCGICKSLWHHRATSSETGKKQMKAKQRENYLKRTYGISELDFRLLLERQDNKCAICSLELTDKPCLDHDHQTGEVRSILCNKCNTDLGLFKESPELLRKAADYLENPPCRIF